MDRDAAILTLVGVFMCMGMLVVMGVVVLMRMGMHTIRTVESADRGTQFRQARRIVWALHPINANFPDGIASTILAHG